MDYMELFGLNVNDPIFTKYQQSEMVRNLKDFLLMRQLYDAGIREVQTKLEILDEEFRLRFDHNPIHHMESRLKSVRSILDKLERRGLPATLDSIRENITDVAGIRVICYYVNDIYRMAELLLTQDDITPVKVRNYITHPKENGYRSLHLVVNVPIFLAEKRQLVPVEIQIRTIAMDFWASLDHELRYKKEDEVPEELRKELRACAQTVAELDDRMQSIHMRLAEQEPRDAKVIE